MASKTECLGMEIKQCAKVVAVIGIILSVCSFNFVGFIIYGLVYVGVDNNKPGYLLPAKIGLIISMILFIITFFICVNLVVAGLHAIDDAEVKAFIHDHQSEIKEMLHDQDVVTGLEISALTLVILILTACITFVYMIFSYVVVSKAREYMLNEISYLSHMEYKILMEDA